MNIEVCSGNDELIMIKPIVYRNIEEKEALEKTDGYHSSQKPRVCLKGFDGHLFRQNTTGKS